MSGWSIVLAVLGSTVLATIVGKLLDRLFLEPQRAKVEQQRWLRESRLEAFARLSEELLSLGIPSGTFIDPWRFRAIAARAVLLIPSEDQPLVQRIHEFTEAVWHMSRCDGSRVTLRSGTAEVPPQREEDAKFAERNRLSFPEVRVNLERGTYMEKLTRVAFVIVDGLGELARDGRLSEPTRARLAEVDMDAPKLVVSGR